MGLFRMELKNVKCCRLGTISYLEIQKGKYSMKISQLKQVIVGTTACTKKTIKATKGYGQLSSNYTLFFNIWFSGVKIAEGENIDRVVCCGPVKTIYKGFCLSMLEN